MDTRKMLEKENYMIYVPSRGRGDRILLRRGLWRYVDPIEKSHEVTLCVREEELSSYPIEQIRGKGVKLAVAHNEATIADKRNSFIEHAISSEVEYMFIIDDDSEVYYRDENLSSKYTSRVEEVKRRNIFDKILLEAMALCSETYPLIGLPIKQGSFGLKYTFPKNIPIIRFVCYHVPTLKKEGIKATGLGTTFMSDRFVQLSLFEKGYRSLSNCRYAIGDPGTGYRGGCSETRTPEKQTEAAKALALRFPNAVSLKVKSNGLWAADRLDCSIKWKSYLKEGEQTYIDAYEGYELINKKYGKEYQIFEENENETTNA